jgi:hypothetical protein
MHCKRAVNSYSPTEYSVAPPAHNVELPLILYTAAVSNLGLVVFGLARATSRTSLCDFVDAVMCSGGYVTLVTDWCCVVCSGGCVSGDRLVLCSV